MIADTAPVLEQETQLTKTVRLMAFGFWERKVKAINKRLAKRGVPVIRYTRSETYLVEESRLRWDHPLRDIRDTVKRPYVDVTIEVEPVKVGGYRSIAVLDYTHSEPIIRAWPGEELNVVAPADPDCDYCGKFRRRSATVVLEQIDTPGSRFYVGKTCVRDFIGFDPDTMLNSAQWVADAFLWSDSSDDDDRDPFSSSGKDRKIDIATILLYSMASIRQHGWRGRNFENGWTTSAIVREAMFPLPRQKGERDIDRPPKIAIADEDKTRATEALEYVRSITEIKSEYVRNLTILARDGVCIGKEFNLAVSMARFLQNEEEKVRERAEWARQAEERRKERADSQHVGSEGDRLRLSNVRVELVKVLPSRDDYSLSTTLVKFRTSDGDCLSWFASSAVDLELEGKDVDLAGTVKRHSEYKGVKETQLTRCKITERVSSEAK